jgi:DNA-binding NarL/FixJ family response regulator
VSELEKELAFGSKFHYSVEALRFIMITVSIVEDDTGIRESLAVLINGSAGFRCISTFANAELAEKHLALNMPDVVLMDINLPKMSGIECLRKLKTLHPRLQIIMLTVYADNEKIFDSLKAGASGYLLKQTPPTEILAAISDVQRGGSPMSSSIARKVVQHFQLQPNTAAEGLSNREIEILEGIAKGHHNKEIADMLGLSIETVRSHLRRIYEKLQVNSRTEAVLKYLGK